jgi:hypothetical protein
MRRLLSPPPRSPSPHCLLTLHPPLSPTLPQLIIASVIDGGSHSIHIKETESFTRADAAHNAYVGAGIYGAFVGASILMLIAGRWRAKNASSSSAHAPLLESQ